MSIVVSTDVFCDGCDGDWVHGTVGEKVQAAAARRVARRAGWVRKQGKDLCPACVAEGQAVR